jgi:microsomal dipeptidase-like Zn-dependent dipeptidase
MERVAKTGGVVCTWPIKRRARKTFLDWAKEILEMKRRLGMDHVGLGTDGGGGVPCLDGYRDIRDLVHLVVAMQEVSFSQEDIKSSRLSSRNMDIDKPDTMVKIPLVNRHQYAK